MEPAESRLYWPVDVSFGPDGTAWVLDWNNHLVRYVTADGKFVTAIGGRGAGCAGHGGPVEDALFNQPNAIAIGPDGALYIADTYNQRIRLVGD